MRRKFTQWLVSHLSLKGESEVSKLLGNQLAIEFLISWSIFEASCFDRFFKPKKIEGFYRELLQKSNYENKTMRKYVEYFHDRYQNSDRYKHLTYGTKYPDFENIINKSVNELEDYEEVFLLIFVVFRYRNNIFHGNKGVSSWLSYQEEIKKCCDIMQYFTDMKHSEINTP